MTKHTSAPLLLTGRRALVTGASGRLGRSLALALARQGATLIVHYRRDEAGARETVRLLQTEGLGAQVLQADLSHPGACENLITRCRALMGGLDILVNNAAIFERAPLSETTVGDFDRHMASNARPVFELSLHAGRAMKRESGGDILNLACVAGARPWAKYLGYSASKAAVVNMTTGFARALAPQVRVNAIAPGPILPPTGGDARQEQTAIAATLLGRSGTPEEVSAAALFLLRARYVTGYTLHVDGGRSIA